jgi:hypothetical protein
VIVFKCFVSPCAHCYILFVDEMQFAALVDALGFPLMGEL